MKEANREVLDQGSLPELLATRARQSSDKRLVLDAAFGILIAASALTLRPPLWMPFSAAAFCLFAYGMWGILDRELFDATGARKRALRVSRDLVAVLGGASAIVFGLTFLAAALGTIIS